MLGLFLASSRWTMLMKSKLQTVFNLFLDKIFAKKEKAALYGSEQ